MNDEEDDLMETMVQLTECARQMGLHGVLILSPVCPDCGQLHDFRMMTDMPVEVHAEGIRDLLLRFAERAASADPNTVVEVDRTEIEVIPRRH